MEKKGRTVGIGIQDFEMIIKENAFYVDKTLFIKDWWENLDQVTLITRPRRFGKTLNLNMVERFFSNEYVGQTKIFDGLNIWKEEKFHALQGTYPVISLSFAKIKETDYERAARRICTIISEVFGRQEELFDSPKLNEEEKARCKRYSREMDDLEAVDSLGFLSECLYKHYGIKPLILLDEYDTPMQEAYISGYWDEVTALFRNLFNATFKSNRFFSRALLTGITRVSKESMFSDLNNLEVVSTTTPKYETYFGFTEEEVFAAMDEMGLTDKEGVKAWYDGFVFGQTKDIYNPWSITNYLDKGGELNAYWANTSSNKMVSKLVYEGDPTLKEDFGRLMRGEILETEIDEDIVFNNLNGDDAAVWSLLVASGYMKILSYDVIRDEWGQKMIYQLALTNFEVRVNFRKMVKDWFNPSGQNYSLFVKALLNDNVEFMNDYLNEVALKTISYFDTGREPSRSEPERFYHGLVLGLLVELLGQYQVTSNRESGRGRYDVMIEPLKGQHHAIIMEFKVRDPKKEADLEETVASALRQIEEKKYEQTLLDKGISTEDIYKYGLAFEGKTVLIGK